MESATNKDNENRSNGRRRLHLREVNSEHEAYDGIGADIRAARTRNGQNLVDVANVLRIRIEFLEALEQGRFTELPAPVYAVGFIRTYAVSVGIDGDDAIKQFKSEAAGLAEQTRLSFPTPEEESRVPRGWLLVLAGISAALIYAGWFYAEEQERLNIAGVPPVPERLAAKIVAEPAPIITTSFAATPPEPVAEVVIGPLAEVIAAPITEVVVEPIAEVVAAPITEVVAEPIAEPIAEPVAEVVAKPIAEPVVEEVVAEVVAEPTAEPIAEAVAEPIAEPVAEPVAEAVAEPIAEPVAEPVAEAVAGPIAEPVAEAVAGPVAEPVAQVVAEIIAEPVAELIAETVAEPVDQVVAEAVVESVAPSVGVVGITVAALPPAATDEAVAAPPLIPQTGRETAPEPQVFGTENINARVVLTARVDVWVQISTTGGATLFSRILRRGDKYLTPNRDDIVLTTGNAGALRIVVDGRDIAPVGLPGAVRRDISLKADRLLGIDASENSRANYP